jgi:hypothetical protein
MSSNHTTLADYYASIPRHTFGYAVGSDTESAWHDMLAAAAVAAERTTYVVADAVTRAPITPFAPFPGGWGVAADITRAYPGLTAVPAGRVAPSERAAFADIAERMADAERRAERMHRERGAVWAAAHADAVGKGMARDAADAERAAETCRMRAERAAADAVAHAERAAAMRATFAAGGAR